MATPTAASPRGVRSGLCCFCLEASAAAGPVLSGFFIPLFFIRGGYMGGSAQKRLPGPATPLVVYNPAK